MHVLIIGAGIGGLGTALSLHEAGIEATVVDSARELRPLGVGINLLPHATRELTELGLGEAIAAIGLPLEEFVHFDRYGNRIWGQPRGLSLGYNWPQYSVHRGELQMMMLKAVRARLGEDAVRPGTAFVRFTDDGTQVTATLRDQATGAEFPLSADALVGADGLHSQVRKQLHPGEGRPLWNGVRMWRGLTEADPYLARPTMAVLGATKRFVCYPISREAHERGRAMVNWIAEVQEPADRLTETPDWNREGRRDEVLAHFADRGVPWLDVPGLIGGAPQILEYPMVDRDPLPFWVRGRVALLGDAAHPMYPIGSNGGSQAIMDARVLAHELAGADSPGAGLAAYERARREPVNAIVAANRQNTATRMLELVAGRAPDGFEAIEDVLAPEELAELSASYSKTSHIDAGALNNRPSYSPTRL